MSDNPEKVVTWQMKGGGPQVRIVNGHVELPEGMTEVPRYAFQMCKDIVSVSSPSVKSIGPVRIAAANTHAREHRPPSPLPHPLPTLPVRGTLPPRPLASSVVVCRWSRK